MWRGTESSALARSGWVSVMQTQVWIPLPGVLLGGGLSYLAQLAAGRQASHSEDRRQAGQLAEARRTERLGLLREFVSLTEEGIRLAERREAAADWEAAATPGWLASADHAGTSMWEHLTGPQILFLRRARAEIEKTGERRGRGSRVGSFGLMILSL